jgi:hypothetical protein
MKKSEILATLNQSREDFLDAIEGLPDDELQQPGVAGDWSVKDLMAHMARWEGELVKLLWQARSGQQPTTIHFTQASVDDTNARWSKDFAGRSLEQVLDDFHGVRNQTIRRVEAFSDKELNDPQAFSWAKGFPLWRWIGSDSFEHEAEHTAQVREWLAGRAEKN